LPLAGNCKFVLLVMIAALVCAATAWGQSAPAMSAGCQPQCCCPDDGCDGRPLFTFPDWMCHRPLCSLFGSSAATSDAPWVSWNTCPISVGAFAGMMNGGPLVQDTVGTKTGFDGGWRIGWDVDSRWGAETRFAFASLSMYDHLPQAAGSNNAELFQWDVEALYYPCRESRLRPYLLAGIGLTDINFTGIPGQGSQTVCLSLPLGIGLKYLWDENFALRLDLLDDIAMSNEHLLTQNNFSLTGGLELRFGGSKKVYWPFDLGR